MAVKFVAVKCPSCGADLPMEEGRTEMFCAYCGAKIIMTNENEHIYHNIDEAAIKKAETERIVQLKKLEIMEKRRAAREKRHKFKMALSLILGAIGLLSFVVASVSEDGDAPGYMVGMVCFIILMLMWLGEMGESNKEDDALDLYTGEQVKIPRGISNYEEQNYASVEAQFRKAGFTNVRTVPLCDLMLGLLNKPGNVDSITVNGREITSGGKKFPSDSTVIISYHSIMQRKG